MLVSEADTKRIALIEIMTTLAVRAKIPQIQIRHDQLFVVGSWKHGARVCKHESTDTRVSLFAPFSKLIHLTLKHLPTCVELSSGSTTYGYARY